MSLSESSILTIQHSQSGASCRVHPFGATVLSFVSSDGRENLFLSRDAKLDGSKAIRGGIPIAFPIFGPPAAPAAHDDKPASTMPQHGFARVNAWTLQKQADGSDYYDREACAGATFTLALKDVTAGRGEHNAWSAAQAALDGTDCLLTYEIRLEAQELLTTLVIQNTGTSSFDFNALLHTYYRIDGRAAFDSKQTHVSGLGGYAISDKVSGDSSGRVQSYDEPVVLQGETDRVYVHPMEADHPTVHTQIAVGGHDKKKTTTTIHLDAAGQVDGQVSPVSAVVWNPGQLKAAAMSDFGDDQYQDMICVEPGLLGHQPLLAPGREARLTQTIRVK